MTELELKDPHVFAVLPLFGCRDITNSVPFTPGASFNEIIQEDLMTDSDNDGNLDLSPIVVFLDPQSITTGVGSPEGGFEIDPDDPGGEAAFHLAQCTAPQEASVCRQDLAETVYYTDYTNGISGTCLAPISGTTTPYEPAVVSTQAPCFVSDPFGMRLDFGELTVWLEDAQVSATYDAPFELLDGIIMGFLTEAVAETTVFDETVPLVGGMPLSSILPGGSGACTAHDDRDVGTDGVTTGWWVYMNFRAKNVSLISTSSPFGPLPTTDHEIARLELAPNPFQSNTTMSYAIPHEGFVRLRIVDVTGRLVRSLVDARVSAGTHSVTWSGIDGDGRSVTPGIYFVRLESEQGSRTRRVVLVR
jgi:hypothetical protein